VLTHPRIFAGYRKGGQSFDYMPPAYRKGEFLDNWGCLWRNECEGIEGQVVGHPLADWNALNSYRPPDPRLKSERQDRDWKKTKAAYEGLRKQDRLRVGSGERLFDRLYFLRGFENLMMDIATDDPSLLKLIDMLLQHEMELVDLWLEVGVDVIGFHTDIGTQNGLMISPPKFRQYIKPLFKKLFSRCRSAGVHVALSSDGRLLEIVDDLVECGVSMHDPQVRANTLAGIEKAYKGKMCINLDLDRQMLPFCTPADIRQQVQEAVERLHSPEGGFMVFAAVTDDNTPLRNIEAICEAFEEYCFNP
jgi:hypothetical protein